MGREMVHVILQKALAKCNAHAFVAIARSASDVRDGCKGESEEEEDTIYDRRGARRNASQGLWGFDALATLSGLPSPRGMRKHV